MNYSVKPQSPCIVPSLSGEGMETERPCIPDGSKARTPGTGVDSRTQVLLALPRLLLLHILRKGLLRTTLLHKAADGSSGRLEARS